MDWSYEELGAWVSLLAIGFASWLFYPDALAHLSAGGAAVELLGSAVFVVIVLVVVEIVYHSIAAVASKNPHADERDKLICLKAERNSGYALAIALFWIIGLIAIRSSVPRAPDLPSAEMIAVYILLALTFSEVYKLVSQVWYYRRGI